MKSYFSKIKAFVIPALVLAVFFNFGCSGLLHGVKAGGHAGMATMNDMPGSSMLSHLDNFNTESMLFISSTDDNQHNITHHVVKNDNKFGGVLLAFITPTPTTSLVLTDTANLVSPPISSGLNLDIGQHKNILRC